MNIENLHAYMIGRDLNTYQLGLALDEFYKLVESHKDLEQLKAEQKHTKEDVINANKDGRQEIANLIIDYISTIPEELHRRFCNGDYSLQQEAEQYYKQEFKQV